jgi:hypothetical protein
LNPFRLQVLRRALADTGGVYPVGFRKSSLGPIELRQSARASFDRQIEAFEPIMQRPSRRIDSRGVFERRFRLRFHMGEIFASQPPILFER